MQKDREFEKNRNREFHQALEYAKEQVVKHRPQRAPKNRSHQADPTEEYVNNLFPEENADDDNGSNCFIHLI